MPVQRDWIKDIKKKHPHLDFISQDGDTAFTDATFRCVIHNYTFTRILRATLDSRFGCDLCRNEFLRENASKITTEMLVRDVKKHRGNRYDVSNVEYKGYWEPIVLTCRKHGDFEATVMSVRAVGGCCLKCRDENRASYMSRSQIKEHIKALGFDYQLLDTPNKVRSSERIYLRCKKHGTFSKQRWQVTIADQGCPACSKAFSRTYLVKLLGRSFHVQGYERYVLPKLITYLERKGLCVDDLVESLHPNRKIRPPIIKYTLDGRLRRHYPDFWIPSQSTLIEVKSTYTAGLIPGENQKIFQKTLKAKAKAARAQGFRYVVLVHDKDRTFVHKV